MVAGDHLHADSGAPTAADGGDRLGAWRVDHALEAEERQAAGDVAVLELRVIGRARDGGRRPAPAALGSHALDGFARVRFVERDELGRGRRARSCSAR